MYSISCVSYTNSLPFVYGLQKGSLKTKINFQLDTPADCFHKLLDGKADIGLVPVVALKKLKEKHLISSYCIGANGNVKSVILVSPSEPKDIKNIYLDYQSRTSVQLARVLCREYWKIQPEFIEAKPGFEERLIPKHSASVIIGDRTFPFYQKNYNIYDLAEHWKKFTKKEFVFAAWIANKPIEPSFIQEFEESLKLGLDARDRIIEDMRKIPEFNHIDFKEYFYQNINYNFSQHAKEGMELFLNLLQ